MFRDMLLKLDKAYEAVKNKDFAAAARVAVCEVACEMLEPAPVRGGGEPDEDAAAACESRVLEIQGGLRQEGVQAGGVIAVLAIELLVTNLPTILEFIRKNRRK
jgi:hypothetical protein